MDPGSSIKKTVVIARATIVIEVDKDFMDSVEVEKHKENEDKKDVDETPDRGWKQEFVETLYLLGE